MPRKPAPTSELKRQILEAAVNLFAKEGLEAVSMRKVAARVGCSATAIYLYFANKEALMEALVRQEFLDLAEAMESLRSVKDPVQRMRDFAQAYVRFALEKSDHYRFIFMTLRPTPSPEALADRGQTEVNAYLMAQEAAAQAIGEGHLRRDLDPHLVAQTLVSGIHGILALHLVGFQDPWLPWHPIEVRVAHMMDSLLAGMAPQPG